MYVCTILQAERISAEINTRGRKKELLSLVPSTSEERFSDWILERETRSCVRSSWKSAGNPRKHHNLCCGDAKIIFVHGIPNNKKITGFKVACDRISPCQKPRDCHRDDSHLYKVSPRAQNKDFPGSIGTKSQSHLRTPILDEGNSCCPRNQASEFRGKTILFFYIAPPSYELNIASEQSYLDSHDVSLSIMAYGKQHKDIEVLTETAILRIA